MNPELNPRDDLLQRVRSGLLTGLITPGDLQGFIPEPSVAAAAQPVTLPPVAPTEHLDSNKLNAIDVLFYLAGVVLYIALMVLLFQNGGGIALGISIAIIPGLLFWVVAYIFGRSHATNDMRRGLSDASVLTGSLAICSGVIVVASQLFNVTDTSQAYPVAVAAVLLGLLHLAFDKLFRHIVLITLSVLLLVGAFPTLFVGLLANADTQSSDIWAAIAIGTGILLALGGMLAAKTTPERAPLAGSFASLGAFIVMGSIYSAGLGGSMAIIWQLLLPLTIYGAFFVSIKRRNKNFLVTGSLYLVLFLITIAFKYFSGAGVVFSLLFSAVSILATAFMAVHINKRFITQAAGVPTPSQAPNPAHLS